MKPKFIYPKTPNINKGYLIIETDDNNIGDYSHWFPLVKRLKYERSQWLNTKFLSVGINTNTDAIGTSGKTTINQIKEMYEGGWEIINHGKSHNGIGRHYLYKS